MALVRCGGVLSDRFTKGSECTPTPTERSPYRDDSIMVDYGSECNPIPAGSALAVVDRGVGVHSDPFVIAFRSISPRPLRTSLPAFANAHMCRALRSVVARVAH